MTIPPIVAELFQLPAYLDRIGASIAGRNTAEELACLHQAHSFNVPFENLDIPLGKDISLRSDDLFDKIVRRHRGGYCFELNGLFATALAVLGYDVKPCLARVIYGRGSPGSRGHEVLIVRADGREWLADVGFGGPGLRTPIPLEVDREELQYGERFKLRHDVLFGYVLQKKNKDQWIDLYAFDRSPALPIDFEMSNFFASRFPQSPFRTRRIAAIAHPWGRVTLDDLQLSIVRDGETSSRTLADGEEFFATLAQHFGLKIDARYEDFAQPV